MYAFSMGPILNLTTTWQVKSLFMLQLVRLAFSVAAVCVMATAFGVTGAAAADLLTSVVTLTAFLTLQSRVRRTHHETHLLPVGRRRYWPRGCSTKAREERHLPDLDESPKRVVKKALPVAKNSRRAVKNSRRALKNFVGGAGVEPSSTRLREERYVPELLEPAEGSPRTPIVKKLRGEAPPARWALRDAGFFVNG